MAYKFKYAVTNNDIGDKIGKTGYCVSNLLHSIRIGSISLNNLDLIEQATGLCLIKNN